MTPPRPGWPVKVAMILGWATALTCTARLDAQKGAAHPAAALTRLWRQPLLPGVGGPDGAAVAVKAALLVWNQRGAPTPAFLPLAARGRLAYRDFRQVNLADARTGEAAWQGVWLDASLDALARHADTWPTAAAWLRSGADLPLVSTTAVALADDGERVYAVDDLAVSPPAHALLPRVPNWLKDLQPRGRLDDLVRRGRLCAFDLRSGKLTWERGRRLDVADKTELADSLFLSLPVRLGAPLYALTERNAEVRLVCLDAAEGELVWAEPLARPGLAAWEEPGRRSQVLRPALWTHALPTHTEQVLVCPTHAGVVVGYDLSFRAKAFEYAYRPGPREREYPLNPAWQHAAVHLAGDRAVFTAPDDVAIHCLRLPDGALAWKARWDDGVYLAGVFEGHALLVGADSCRALSLQDGKVVWETKTGKPSGVGVLHAGTYLLPLRAAEGSGRPALWALNPRDGKVLSRHSLPDEDVPGNLVVVGDVLVSQGVTEIAGYALSKAGR